MRWKALVLGSRTGGLLGLPARTPLVRDLVAAGGPGPAPRAHLGLGRRCTALRPAADRRAGRPSRQESGPCVNLQCQQTTCLSGACTQQRCPGGSEDHAAREGVRPRRTGAALQRAGLRPQRAAGSDPGGPHLRPLRHPHLRQADRLGAHRHPGEFLLDNVPVGDDIPLVIQVGKWRRELRIPRTQACAETVSRRPQPDAPAAQPGRGQHPQDRPHHRRRRSPGVPAAQDRHRRQRVHARVRHRSGQPLLGAGRRAALRPPPPMHLRSTPGSMFTPATTFWEDPAAFKRYDMVLLSCEGMQYPADKSPAAAGSWWATPTWAAESSPRTGTTSGCREGPVPWSDVATFTNTQQTLPNNYLGEVQTTFPKGNALADWLVNVGASTTRGQLPIQEGKRTVGNVNPTYSTAWIQSPAGQQPAGVQYFTFNTPGGAMAGKECGRVVFTDIHVSAGDVAGPPFPTGCITTELSPSGKGARVHPVRPVIVRAARRQAARHPLAGGWLLAFMAPGRGSDRGWSPRCTSGTAPPARCRAAGECCWAGARSCGSRSRRRGPR